MNKIKGQQLLALILLLVAILMMLAFLGKLASLFSPRSQAPKKETLLSVQQPQIEKSKATAKLSFSPNQASLKAKEQFKVKVMVDSGENSLTGAELYLLYDPTLLEVKKVVPGDFFAKPNILINEVDPVKGEISYALGTFTSEKGKKGFLTEITFSVKAVTREEMTTLAFSSGTKLADVDKEASALKSMALANFTILP